MQSCWTSNQWIVSEWMDSISIFIWDEATRTTFTPSLLTSHKEALGNVVMLRIAPFQNLRNNPWDTLVHRNCDVSYNAVTFSSGHSRWIDKMIVSYHWIRIISGKDFLCHEDKTLMHYRVSMCGNVIPFPIRWFACVFFLVSVCISIFFTNNHIACMCGCVWRTLNWFVPLLPVVLTNTTTSSNWSRNNNRNLATIPTIRKNPSHSYGRRCKKTATTRMQHAIDWYCSRN